MHAYFIVLGFVTIQKGPLGISQCALHEQISLGRVLKACEGGNLQQYITFTFVNISITFTYHLSLPANTNVMSSTHTKLYHTRFYAEK